MACMIKPQSLILLITFGMLIRVSYSIPHNGGPQVPCYFIFGDSLVDGGNNNNLNTLSKVNYAPYGIDFPNGPTGRFTNGKTSADILGELLGFKKFIPSFITATDSEILTGVNYASGSAGILPETGKHMGDNIDMYRQLQNHQTVIQRIINIFNRNETAANEHLNKCLYIISTGNNDYINNYFLPNISNSSKIYSPRQFADILTKNFHQQLQQLHKLGARRVGINSVSTIGCTPNATALFGTPNTICVDKMTHAANLFNRRIATLVLRLNFELANAKFIQLGSLGFDPEITYIPGVNVQLTSCCPLNEKGFCVPNQRPCINRPLALFWDAFHPTEIVNQVTARSAHLLIKTILV